VKECFIYNQYLIAISFALFAIRYCYLLIIGLRPKVRNVSFLVLLFIGVLLLDGLLTTRTELIDLFYFSITPIIFLPLAYRKIQILWLEILITIAVGSILFVVNNELITQLCYIISFSVILFNSKDYLISSTRDKYLGYIMILIAVFYLFTIMQYALYKIGTNWRGSQYLIYYTFTYLAVITTTFVIIYANFRRLFFN
jgi:hypothetical protein